MARKISIQTRVLICHENSLVLKAGITMDMINIICDAVEGLEAVYEAFDLNDKEDDIKKKILSVVEKHPVSPSEIAELIDEDINDVRRAALTMADDGSIYLNKHLKYQAYPQEEEDNG